MKILKNNFGDIFIYYYKEMIKVGVYLFNNCYKYLFKIFMINMYKCIDICK